MCMYFDLGQGCFNHQTSWCMSEYQSLSLSLSKNIPSHYSACSLGQLGNPYTTCVMVYVDFVTSKSYQNNRGGITHPFMHQPVPLSPLSVALLTLSRTVTVPLPPLPVRSHAPVNVSLLLVVDTQF